MAGDLIQQLTAVFEPPVPVSDAETPEVSAVWTVSHVEVAAAAPVTDVRLRTIWRRRQGNRATPLLLVTGADVVRALGPRAADEPIRQVRLETLLRILRSLEGKSRRDATAALAEALERTDRAGIPGVRLTELLTKHVLSRRLRAYRPEAWRRLEEAAANVRADRDWRENLVALGYSATALPGRGYLLRYDNRPIAVVHPLADPGAFSRTTEEGSFPEGVLVSDCRREGVAWGLLAARTRFRLFPSETPVGAATGRYLELDIAETDPADHAYLGLLAPGSLAPGGLLQELIDESMTLGNELRDEVERRIRDRVLPSLARGLGTFVASPPRQERLESPNVRKLIEDAALLLMFRVLFFLYLESRGYLPYSSAAYRPHSATQLLADARAQDSGFDSKATMIWDRFVTLVKAMRTGSTTWGLPAYNGDLFAADSLVGAELLEEASLADAAFGPALAALAADPDAQDGAGVDYGDLEIAHLGRIYEGLLTLRLSLADTPLVFDARPKVERWLPAAEGQEAEVEAGELFYQTESGGRKAAGVYYTPQVIVRHLVDHAVMPALEAHLERVASVAKRNVNDAAAMLFDFRVLDPAMGSAHFLADALDRIAERIGTFLADHPLKPISRMLDDLRAEASWEGTIEDGKLFRRLVLKRCIYGVDLSDMAVEVAKVSLWLASFVPGLSLTYLGHNLKQGDALVGVADPVVLEDLGPMFALYDRAPIPRALAEAREIAQRVVETPDRKPEEVEASRAAEDELREITGGLTRVFDVWCSEPFGAKGARGWLGTGAAEKVLAGEPATHDDRYLEPAMTTARDRSFFHWPAEFPEVFIGGADRGGGFDVVIGNPPWEELTVEELAFYTLHDPGIRGIKEDAERRRRIEQLTERYPYLRMEFERRQRDLEGKRRFFGPQGGYVIQGTGDTDLYKLFSERYRSLTRDGGWLGVVLPRSAFLVDGSRGFRRELFSGSEVARLDFILNAGRWAFDMEPRYTIVLLAAQRVRPVDESATHLTGPSASRASFEANVAGDGVSVGRGQLVEWTRLEDGPGFEVPLLPTVGAVGVFDKMRQGPRFTEGHEGRWSAFPVRELDETNDKKWVRENEGVPVWKGRCFDRYDPHGEDPAGFAVEEPTLVRLQAKRVSTRSAFKGRFPDEVLTDSATHPFHSARIAFRDVSRATDSRTVRACLVPPRTFLTNSAPYLAFPGGGPREQAFVLGVMNSLPFDWQARRFVETHMNFYVLDMLCLPRREDTDVDAIAERAARLSSVDERFTDFATACGVFCGPLDQDERVILEAEIDALVAKAYGLSPDDLEIVFSDFTLNAVPEAQRERVREALLGT